MFEAALKQAIAKFEQAKESGLLENFALIGGLAVSRWSKPRATVDIDLAIALGNSQLEELADFFEGEFRKGDIRDPLQGSITFQITSESGAIPVQALQFPKSWEEVAFHDVDSQTLEGVNLPIVDWKALVLLKLYAGSALDLQDAENILATVSPKKSDLEHLKNKAQTLRVSRKLEKILA